MKVHLVESSDGHCPACSGHNAYDFANSDDYLTSEVPRILEERRVLGLDGLSGDLACLVINVEPDRLRAAAREMINRTGFRLADCFESPRFRTVVLKVENSADILLRCRISGANPFLTIPGGAHSDHLPATRLEAFFFRTPDIRAYKDIQQGRGVRFLPSEEVRDDGMASVQTLPSSYTGLSIGQLEMTEGRDSYRTRDARNLDLELENPDDPVLDNIGSLDHTATRVRAENRDAAIVEFIELTGYRFDFAIYVKLFNSITNVARLSGGRFAMVFTSGINPDRGQEDIGPTEQFVRNYGARVHHMALRTEKIETVWRHLADLGQEFLVDLVGSPEEGLKQTFTKPSPNTLLVTELIHRYGDFDGFFTKSNVTLLTEATARQ